MFLTLAGVAGRMSDRFDSIRLGAMSCRRTPGAGCRGETAARRFRCRPLSRSTWAGYCSATANGCPRPGHDRGACPAHCRAGDLRRTGRQAVGHTGRQRVAGDRARPPARRRFAHATGAGDRRRRPEQQANRAAAVPVTPNRRSASVPDLLLTRRHIPGRVARRARLPAPRAPRRGPQPALTSENRPACPQEPEGASRSRPTRAADWVPAYAAILGAPALRRVPLWLGWSGAARTRCIS